jgi:exodeoxyribonuclease VII small subunit
MTAESTDDRTFEQALADLEDVVAELERGDLELEESLTRYEAGLRSYRRCLVVLEGVEQRVELLDGEERRPFGDEGEGES